MVPMTTATGSTLRELEGRRVSLALTDGSRLDGAMLVSAGRGHTRTLWVHSAGSDIFVARRDVVAAWEAHPVHRPHRRTHAHPRGERNGETWHAQRRGRARGPRR